MKTITPLIALAPLLLISSVAAAQATDASAEVSQRRAFATTPLAATPPAPTGRSDAFVEGPTFELKVSEDQSQASIQFGGYARDETPAPNGDRQINGSWSVKVSIPVGGGDDLTARSTLDALGDGPKVTFNYSWFTFRSAAANQFTPEFATLMEQARRACERSQPADPRDCAPPGPDPGFARRYLGNAVVNRALYHDIFRYGLEGSAGINRFSHIHAATLAERHDMELQLSASAFLAWYPARGTNALIGQVEYQNAWEAAETTIICRPVVVTPATDCVSGAPTRPDHVERLNASVEYRQVIALANRRAQLAISPRATIDALSGEYELELPVYFIPHTDLPLLPGISIAYSSEKNDVTFGVFLRTSFSLN